MIINLFPCKLKYKKDERSFSFSTNFAPAFTTKNVLNPILFIVLKMNKSNEVCNNFDVVYFFLIYFLFTLVPRGTTHSYMIYALKSE